MLREYVEITGDLDKTRWRKLEYDIILPQENRFGELEYVPVITPFCLFEFKVITLGFKTFKRYINIALRGIDCCFTYTYMIASCRRSSASLILQLRKFQLSTGVRHDTEQHIRVVELRKSKFNINMSGEPCQRGGVCRAAWVKLADTLATLAHENVR